MFCIYKATNKLTGKVYIGKTNDFEKRKREHLSDFRSSHLFSRAIRKYGAENFEWEIVESEILTNEQASEREKFWVAKFHSYFRDKDSKGYNMTRGGDGGSLWNVKKVASYDECGSLKKVFSSLTEASKYYGIPGSSSISRCCRDISKKCHGMRFQYFYNEAPETICIPEQINKKWKPILQYSEDGRFIAEYKSVAEAVKSTGCRRSGIIACAKGVYKSSEGFVWVYKCDSSRPHERSPLRAYGDVRVCQFDFEGNFIAQFYNCSDAARSIGKGTNKGIHKALGSNTHKAYGFLWYKSNDVNMPIPR